MWIRSRLFSLVHEKGIVAAIWKLVYTAAAYSSAIYAFVEILIVGISGVEDWSKKYWWAFLAAGVVATFIHNREKTTLRETVCGLQIEVKINDLFCVKANSYVIPTNTLFRTRMDGEYISPESVQGAFQLKYYKGKLDVLDNLIKQSLEEQGLSGEKTIDKFGTVQKYPVGTVAKIDRNGKHYYFLAINDVNEFGKPVGQKYENIDKALAGLIETIQNIGHCDELASPLIGTGRAAIKGAGKEKVVKSMIEKFTDSPNKIAKKLIICITPKDYIEGTANIVKIQKLLNYKHEFGNDDA